MIKNLLTYRIDLLLKTMFCLWLFLALGTTDVRAQFAITEDFRGNGNADIIIGGPGGAEGAAYLTSGVNDPMGSGFLRLTNSNTYQKGYAYVNKSFPSTMGVLVDFEYKMWRDVNDSFAGADGIGVFLYDAATTFQLGGYGGSLGYAPGGGSTTGLAGGYVGVGLDAYGNYSNGTEGRNGGPGETPNAVVLRGITTTNTATTNTYLSGIALGDRTGGNDAIRARNELDYNTQTATRVTDANFYRRVQVEVVRLDAAGIYYNVIVRWKKSPNADFTYLTDYITTDVPPALLKLGFAASSGGGVNYHEIRNLLVTTPGNLRVVKRADKDVLRTNNAANGTITYTVEVTNDTDFELNNIQFYDKITDSYGDDIPEGASGFDITSITATGFVSASLPTASTLTTNEITGTLVLGAKTTGRITIVGRLYVIPPGNVLQNTATATPLLDEDLNNNTSVIRTPVTSENVDIVLTKTVTEQCITSGTPPTFTVKASNIGAVNASYNRLGTNGTRIAIYNVVPNGYVYDDSSTPGGFAGVYNDAQNSNVTARWSKIVLTDTPSAGLTTYGYIARGTNTSGASETLMSGATYPYSVTYTITPPVGTTNYTDVSTAMLFTDLNYTTSIETVENRSNNNAEIDMTVKPVAPTVPAGTIYYCVDEAAVPLTATASGTNTLRWYSTPTGFSSEFPITPNTNFAGTYTYYVSQVNGDCEGPKATITVSVGPSSPGSISGNGSVCSGSTVAFTGTASTPAASSYKWQSSPDGATWTTIAGATGISYTTAALTATTYFRRLTTVTANGKTCEGPTNWIRVFIPTAGAIGNSQSQCDNDNDFNPAAFTNVQSGDTGTINGIAYTYQWQRSNNGTTGWTDINGANSATYDSGNIANTRYFRRLVEYTVGGSDCSVSSNIVVAYIGPDNNNNLASGTIEGNQTICPNTIPSAITSSNNGGTGYYIWEYSTDNTNFYPINDASSTSPTYTPTQPITQTTYYRRSKANGCRVSPATVVTKTVNIPAPGSIGNNQTICYGATPTALASPESGTTGYRWEYAEGTTGNNWQSMANTSATITLPALTTSRRYRRFTITTLNSVTCESVASNVITITVKQQTSAGTITGSQSICNGGSAVPITGTQVTSDDAITYTWQISANGSTGWATATGTTNQQSYTPTVTGYYRRRATTACGTYDTNNVLVTIQGVTQTGTITAASTQTICYGATPATLTSATAGSNTSGGGAITYRWEVSADGSTGWTTATGTSNAANYSPGALTATAYYRRIAIATLNGNACESAPTANVVVTVLAASQSGTIANSQTVCFGTAPSLLTSASGGAGTGSGTITYQWYDSGDNSAFNPIGGATAETYQPGTLTSPRYYRRITISTLGGNVCQSGFSNTLTISVAAQINDPGSLTSSNQYICNGGTPAQITSQNPGVVSSPGVLSYAWQSSTDSGTTWSADIAGATGANYSPPGPITQTTVFRRITLGTYGTTVCRSGWGPQITINIAPIATAGTIGNDQTVCSGTTPAQTVDVTGGTNTNGGYLWQVSTDNLSWSDIVGATNAVYQPTAPITVTTYYRRFGVANSGGTLCRGTVPSNVITMTIQPIPTAGTIGSNQTVCGNTAPALLTSVVDGTGGTSYQWQLSYGGSPTDYWENIAGATAATYQPAVLSTIYYRRLTINGACSSAPSNVVLMTVNDYIDAGAIATDQTICAGNTPAPLTSANGGYAPSSSYRWDVSTNGTTWISTGVTTAGYAPGALAATRYYRRAIMSAVCSGEAYTGTITITVIAEPSAGSLTADQNICVDTVPVAIGPGMAGTGSGTITYRWEWSPNGSTGWTTIAGATSDSYQPSVLTATAYYRRITIATSTVGSTTVVCESPATSTVIVTTRNCKVITNPMVRQRVN